MHTYLYRLCIFKLKYIIYSEFWATILILIYFCFNFRYHDNKMVNYDTQDGFSVSSFQSPNHHHSSSSISSIHSGSGSSNTGTSTSSQSGSISNNGGSSSNNFTNSLVSSSLPQTTYLKVPSTSVLTIQEVHFKHAGNYTCAPSNARQTSITVHVLRG